MNIRDLQIGDVLFRPKFGTVIEHEGVFIGHGLVLHNTPERGEHAEGIANFCKGRDVRVWRPNGINTALVNERSNQILQNPSAYDFLVRNCQHTVSAVVAGVARSWIVFVIGVILVLGLIWCLRRK